MIFSPPCVSTRIDAENANLIFALTSGAIIIIFKPCICAFIRFRAGSKSLLIKDDSPVY